MTWKRILTLAIAVALGAGAWRAGGWAGLALAASALVLWFLLYYTRLIQVMKRAADRPIGYVGSAVMLNAKLKPRQALLHVIALTQALGERLSPEGAEPEVYRWTDPGGSHVTAGWSGPLPSPSHPRPMKALPAPLARAERPAAAAVDGRRRRA